ncbi:MAG: histidine kinase dimerization/phosphoacceptor domain -containing protein [Bacteroidia bacterium]
MTDESINLLEEIDQASKIHLLEKEDMDALITVIGHRIALALKIERISVWLFNMEGSAIVSMGEYDLRNHRFSKNTTLHRKDYPAYFNAIEENKILLAGNIYTNPATAEFTESYSQPNDIISLMDIPLRIAGDLVGVMCFEKTGNKERIFTGEEQAFAFGMSLVFASNLEARRRRVAQRELEETVREKEILIKEINHRVKNNFAILIGLLRLSKLKGKNTDPRVILEEHEQRVFSMMKIQDLLYQTHNYTSVSLCAYLNELVKELRRSHPELAGSIDCSIGDFEYNLPTKNAIHLGLIITEVFLNSIKYASATTKSYQLRIELRKDSEGSLVLTIGDNGKGFDYGKNVKKDTLGLPLIKDLVQGTVKSATYPTPGNAFYKFVL